MVPVGLSLFHLAQRGTGERAAGVPRALPQYLAVSITMGLRFH